MAPTSETTASTEVATPAVEPGIDGTHDAADNNGEVTQDAETVGAEPKPLAVAQVVIGGVSLAMNEAEVRAVLGEPQAVTEEDYPCCGLTRRLQYPQMTVGFIAADPASDSPESMILYSLFTADPAVVTNRDIQVGSSRQAVIEAYGPPAFENMTTRYGSPEEESRFPALYYTVEYEGSWLAFVLDENDQVVEIIRDEQLN
ncbi:MAG: hypothetical protein ACHWZW_06870 [Spirulina sp.]